jgi:hypothetical protein
VEIMDYSMENWSKKNKASARYAARGAGYAARDAEGYAAKGAAGYAARGAGYSAGYAARSAEYDARDAARGAARAAWDAAGYAEGDALMIKILKQGIKLIKRRNK